MKSAKSLKSKIAHLKNTLQFTFHNGELLDLENQLHSKRQIIQKLNHDISGVLCVKEGMTRAWGEINDGATAKSSVSVAEQLKQKQKQARAMEQDIHKV